MRAQALSLALPVLTVGTAQAQTLGQGGTELAISPWRVLASCLLCLALGVGAIFALRRRFATGPGRLLAANGHGKRIRVVEQQYLGPHRSLCLLTIDGEEYVCLFSAQAASLLPRTFGGGKGECGKGECGPGKTAS